MHLLPVQNCHQHGLHCISACCEPETPAQPIPWKYAVLMMCLSSAPFACVIVVCSLLQTPRAKSSPSNPAQQAGCAATVRLCSLCSAASPACRAPAPTQSCPPRAVAGHPMSLLCTKWSCMLVVHGPVLCLPAESQRQHLCLHQVLGAAQGPGQAGLHQVPAAPGQ